MAPARSWLWHREEQWDKQVLLHPGAPSHANSQSCFFLVIHMQHRYDSFHTLPRILILPSSGQDFYQTPEAACVKLPSLEEPVQLNLLKSVQKLHMLLEWELFFTLLLP